MRMLGSVVIALSILIAGTSTLAEQKKAQPIKLATMRGKCHKLLIPGADVTSICHSAIANFIYPTGKSSFQFVANDKASIGFFGTDSKAVNGKAILLVEKITFNLLMGAGPTSATASGTCTYTNPYDGPSLVQCSARTEQGLFEATFVSDGSEPS